MKKFLAVFKQAGEGCDYTIGCGIAVHEIEAENREKAFEKAMKGMGWWDYYVHPGSYDERDLWPDEEKMKSVAIYEIKDENHTMFSQFVKDVTACVRAANLKDERRNDEEELQRLADKLGKKVQ